MRLLYFYIYHPAGKEWFASDERYDANVFAQRLANETGKVITRYDINGGKETFNPAY